MDKQNRHRFIVIVRVRSAFGIHFGLRHSIIWFPEIKRKKKEVYISNSTHGHIDCVCDNLCANTHSLIRPAVRLVLFCCLLFIFYVVVVRSNANRLRIYTPADRSAVQRYSRCCDRGALMLIPKSAVAAAAVSVHCVCMFQRVCGQPLQINATIETTTSQGTFVIVSVFDILFRSCVRNVNARTIN